jgi:hypothetical protein
MLFPDLTQDTFDFDSLLKDPNYMTACGLKVKIDKILRDVTRTTVLGISGTMVLRGVRVRGLWDMYGNIIECKKTLNLFSPRQLMCNVDALFECTTKEMFRLVHVQEIKNESE